MRSALLLLAFLVSHPGSAGAQVDSLARVAGRVVDAVTGSPVEGVVVRAEGVDRSALSGPEGRYVLVAVPPGPRVLRATRLGYATRRVSVAVPPRGAVTVDIHMAQEALEVEGLTVTADPVSRARGELGTASVIESDAIRNQTATSLAGLLELIPGVELTPPGLEGVQQIALRAIATSGTGAAASGTPSASELAAFGTLIILDGVPLSNNANLQTLGSRGELNFSTSAGGGVDLRRLPASTIERVEVIRGVPSVRYGDLTQGAIVVDTRAGAFDSEATARFDARSSEWSTVGGTALADRHVGSWTFDLTRSRSLPGVTDDLQHRVVAQGAHRYTSSGGGGAVSGLTLDSRVDVFQLFDDQPEDPNVRPGRASWSRDRGLRVSERGRLRLGGRGLLRFTASYTRVEQESFTTAQRVREGAPFTDRLIEGRSVGRFVQGRYDAEVRIDGVPQLLYGRVEVEDERGWLGARHSLLGGLELRREWTSGPGYQFDMEFPPQVNFNGVQGYDRPRTYDAVPALATSALYIGDRIHRPLRQGFAALQLGLRMDVLHEGDSWITGVRSGSLQPRLNMEWAPRPWMALRVGWGRTAKVPSLGSLYPAPQYHDAVNVNYFANDPAERLAVLTTSVLDATNPSLGFSVADKMELGVDLAWKKASLSVVAFRDRIHGGVGIRQEPRRLVREHFQLTDSVLGNGVRPELIEPSYRADTVAVLLDRPDNHVEQESRGVEVTAMLPELPLLRTRLHVQGAWIRTRQWSDALYFGSSSDFDNFQLLEHVTRTPYWEGAVEEAERALLTYRAIHHEPELGLVLTATVQHNLWDERQDVGGTDTLSFAGYLTNAAELVPVRPERRTRPEFADLRRTRTGLFAKRRRTPGDWLLSLQVTKTLPLDGRISFWAFNALDHPGKAFAPDVLPRFYPSTRFGLEVLIRPWALWR